MVIKVSKFNKVNKNMIYEIGKIEKIENGYIVSYWNAGDKKQIFKTLKEVLEFIEQYYENKPLIK